jgi:hypothetical protein
MEGAAHPGHPGQEGCRPESIGTVVAPSGLKLSSGADRLVID